MLTGAKRFVTVVVVMLLLLGAGVVSAMAEEDSIIKIGITYPPTVLPAMTEEEEWGIDLVVDEINQAGGILGRKLVVIMEQDECQPAPGVTALRKLVYVDNVDALMGPICSRVALAQLPVVQEVEIPYLMCICTNPGITDLIGVGGNEWGFRLNINDEMQVEPYAKWIMSLGEYETFSIITENEAFGRDVAALWSENLPKYGGKILSILYAEYGMEQTDYTSFITRVKADNPDAILLTSQIENGAKFVNQAASLGLVKPVFNIGGLVSTRLIDLVGEELAENCYSVAGYAPDIDTPENEAWVEAFMNWPANKEHDMPTKISTENRVGLYVLKQAFERAGTTDKAAVREALEQTDYESIIGRIRFDDHHQAWANVYVLSIVNGEIVMVASIEQEQPE